MPYIPRGNYETDLTIFEGQDLQYEYPEGLDFKPGTELHDKIVDRIMGFAQESYNSISNRHSSWNDMDKFLTTYKRQDDDEKDVQDDDDRKPTSIVFPYSYAILETLLAYMSVAFFQTPIFEYEGYGPDDVMGSILLTKVVQLHCNKFKVPLNLHTMFRDGFVYGIGPVAPIWETTANGRMSGNALMNLDPYRILPDPYVSIERVQKGEFFGWVNDTNLMDLLLEEEGNPDLFNVKYLAQLKNRGQSVFSGDQSMRTLKAGTNDKYINSRGTQITEINMYLKLIPADWGLGDSMSPEKWFFRIGNDNILLTARPADFDHDKFPIAIAAPDFDGYSNFPLSRLEILSGLQGVLDFLFNSHITNVRKAVNDTFVVDPQLININDFAYRKEGGIVRLRRPSWGRGVKDAIEQLRVDDVTQAHVADSTWIVEWMQKIGATDDAAMGALRKGGPERLTKAEFQGTSQGAVSRLERVARVIGMQAMQDIGEFFADHTQQMLDEETYLKIAGDWQQTLIKEYQPRVSRGRMKVDPSELDVMYDVVVKDGSVPGGNYSQIWMQMFEAIAGNPELQQTFDIVRIFKNIARNNGAKDVNSFIRNNVMPDEQVQREAEKGNIVPMGRG